MLFLIKKLFLISIHQNIRQNNNPVITNPGYNEQRSQAVRYNRVSLYQQICCLFKTTEIPRTPGLGTAKICNSFTLSQFNL
jgi:hypothetical protein